MLPDKKIRMKSEKVSFPLTKEKQELIANMIKHIDDSQLPGSKDRPGVGLAAVQVGHLDRMYYINAPASDGQPAWREFFINPVIKKKKGPIAALEGGEGCLSVGDEIPGQEGLVHREWEVIIEGYSFFQKKIITIKRVGYQAIIAQHEQDHLNANLFMDRIDKFDPWKLKKDEVLI